MDISIRGLALKWWSKLDDKKKDIEAISYFHSIGKKDKNKNELTDYEIEKIYQNWLISD